jgi:hypothetical protein
MYARAARGQAPHAGTVLPAPDVGQLPPPIPGDAATFSYSSQIGDYPWAFASWAGGYPLATYPGGGVLAHALADAGVVQVQAWWPDALTLQLVRITPDGVRHEVRSGFPLIVSTATRRNYASNPSLEAGLNGYTPDAGSPTLSQLADAAAPAGSYVLRATNAGSGSNGVAIPVALTVTPVGRPLTVAFSLRTSALASSVTVSVAWTDSGGGALSTNSTTLSADQRSAAVGQFTRPVISFTPPSGAVTPTVKVTAGGMPAGGTLDLDAISVEVGTTDGSFFDGRTLGGLWVGTADLSASILAPVATILDAECPLDTLVSYQVSNPGITGGRVVSDPVLLSANGNSWLTHPSLVGAPVKVNITTVPRWERTVDQGVFLPIGATRPIVVSSAARQASTGTVEFVAFSFAERDALLDLFDDPLPLLLRAPLEFGFTDSVWLAIGTVSEDRGERKAWQDTVLLSAEVTEVDVPPVL